MKHSTILYSFTGLTLSVLLSMLLTLSAVHPAAYPAAAAGTPASADSAGQAASDSQWDRQMVYVGGDRTVYEGHVYRAKWWTQGEIPGQADVWEVMPEAPDSQALHQSAQHNLPAIHPEGFRVVGYYPSWKPGDTSRLRLDVLTHINYAFAIPTHDGGLRPLENPDAAQTILRQAHAADIKVLLAVGGWSYQDVPLEATFLAATATAEKRQAFVDAMISLCNQYGFDGVDMDWEHPRVDGASAAQYEAMMLLLAQRLHSEGKLLSCAVLSGATPDGNVYYDAAAHSDKVLAAVDYINVMAYDGGDGERHSSYDFAVACGNYWRNTRGVPADKVVLGIPCYARPSWAAYRDLLQTVPSAALTDHISYQGMEVWYNGPDLVRAKTAYAAEQLGGVMLWEVTQDTSDIAKSLQTAISDTLTDAGI